MQEKETNDLEQELGSTHISDYSAFVQKNKDSMLSSSRFCGKRGSRSRSRF